MREHLMLSTALKLAGDQGGSPDSLVEASPVVLRAPPPHNSRGAIPLCPLCKWPPGVVSCPLGLHHTYKARNSFSDFLTATSFQEAGWGGRRWSRRNGGLLVPLISCSKLCPLLLELGSWEV